MGDDRSYMMRAIDLARQAEGHTSPNPMVGCVLVKDGGIIAEGLHTRAGTAHAEAAALARAGDAARGATAYVTLEPCNHYGQNPPCSGALIDAGIAEVVYAVADPNPVATGGAEKLRGAGIKVRTGVCADEAEELIRFWLHRIKTGTPYVVAKFAASLDGKIATRTGDSKWITSAAARARGHDLRQMCDALIVGVETVIADDPSLTARPACVEHAADPLRVILDSNGRVPLEAIALHENTPGRSLIATTSAMPPLKEQALAGRNVEVLRLPEDETGRPCLNALLETLTERGCISCMIEGGGTVLGSFFDRRLVNEVWAFLAPVIIGGAAPSPVAGRGSDLLADAFRLQNTSLEQLNGNLLMRGLVPPSTTVAEAGQIRNGGAA